uniref:hypothetical protein n=1 Tax=Acinetobacter gerneri TaxID=202952 RepID=UPI00293BAE25|nr:hypothetical protein [Acinetobacter gerneri]WNL65185.1 hypothetical protein GPGIFMOB_00136 [Acinetobacter gerneri]
MSNHEPDDMDNIGKEAEEALKPQPDDEHVSEPEQPAKTAKKGKKVDIDENFFAKHKKLILIGGGVLFFLLVAVVIFGNQNIEVERPQQSDVELEARLQSEVARRVKEESMKLVLSAMKLSTVLVVTLTVTHHKYSVMHKIRQNRIQLSFLVCRTSNLSQIRRMKFTLKSYPLKVDAQNPQSSQRKGSVCSPNNVHLFLCQKIVMKILRLWPIRSANYMRLRMPSMTYRLQISSRPITPSDIDLTLISTELDKMNADSATASEPELECVPPDPKKILLRTTYTKQGHVLSRHHEGLSFT